MGNTRRTWWRAGVAGVAIGAVSCALVGCGGDDSTTIPQADAGEGGTQDVNQPPIDTGTDTTLPPEASADTGGDTSKTTDTGTDTGRDAAADSPADATMDTSTACSPSGSACGTADLCKSAVCSPCVDPTDDSACSAAYADGAATGYICKAGACTAGNCHTSANCAGELCNGSNVCTACTTDAQCVGDPTYGSGTVCNTTTGTCVADTCTTANAVCPANAADICCASGGGDTCVAGNCCSNAQCTGATPACQGNTCTACNPVASNAYFVDPVNGSDGVNSTGSGMAGGATNGVCAFKTIRHALAAVGANPPSGTTITVLSDDSTAINGETFPLDVPTNTIVQGATASVKISVTGNVTLDGGVAPADGFHLGFANSGLTSLTLDGLASAGGARGVVVGTGSTATTTLGNITINGFKDAGIRIEGTGMLTVGPGTVSTSNLYGIHVTNSGTATITGSATAATQFNANAVGILVALEGSINLTGTPGTMGSGTVVANANTGVGGQDGVVFLPSTNVALTLPTQSVINGLVVWNSGTNGMHIYGGANVKVRNSYILNNTLNGITVSPNPDACGGLPSCDNQNYSSIDLGNSTGADWGLNTLQDVPGGSPNKAVGICFQAGSGTLGSVLKAQGNIFGTANCSTTAAMLTRINSCQAGSNADLGVTNTNNTISTTMCTN